MSRPLVTVNALTAQVRDAGRITLPEDALITPAAADWLQGTRVPVERVRARSVETPTGPRRYLIGDAGNATVQTLVRHLERSQPCLEFLSCDDRRECLLKHVRTVADGIARCDDERAAIVVDKGAIAACVANKFVPVRAAILQQPSDLFALQHELAINVLIIEKERTSLRQAQGAIDTFFNGKARLDPRIESAIGDSITTADSSQDCTRCAL